ncbi:MAG: hypothetical protein GJ680_21285 [Alteromonadaceae bacterium]|nr:hypothetical protein [Alteromonadaceae bacterium]
MMDENAYTFEEALRELNGCDKESTLRNWIKEFGLLEGEPHLIKGYENGASAKRPGRKVLKITEAGIKRIQRFINWRRWALGTQ